MTHRILLADDAPTIHKFVAYTFMDGPFELDIAVTVEEVEKKLSDGQYDIVLLDFGLSESIDGHELAKKINAQSNQSSIIMLLDRFDVVDEKKLIESGVWEKIVKPFDYQHLMKVCQEMLQTSDGKDQDWQMEGTALIAPPPLLDEGQLKRELQDWSTEVPPVIGATQEEQNFITEENIPPVIAEESVQDITVNFEMLEIEEKVPSNKDLEYPKPKTEEDKSIPENMGGIKLTPLSELTLNIESEEESVDNKVDNEKTTIVEQAVTEETSPDLFWTLDEDQQEQTTAVHSKIDANDIMEKLRPVIEENIRHYCKEIVEKVAWEIIPELAENVIKKEIQEIKDSVVK